MSRSCSGRREAADEGGAVTTFVVLMVVPMVLMAALAFDGGVLLTGRREAFDVAQNAAIAGAQAINASAVRQGEVSIGNGDVQAAAIQYLVEVGHTGTVLVSPTEVTVTVTQEVDLQLLSILGISTRTVSGTATSRIVRGVDGPDS